MHFTMTVRKIRILSYIQELSRAVQDVRERKAQGLLHSKQEGSSSFGFGVGHSAPVEEILHRKIPLGSGSTLQACLCSQQPRRKDLFDVWKPRIEKTCCPRSSFFHRHRITFWISSAEWILLEVTIKLCSCCPVGGWLYISCPLCRFAVNVLPQVFFQAEKTLEAANLPWPSLRGPVFLHCFQRALE